MMNENREGGKNQEDWNNSEKTLTKTKIYEKLPVELVP